MILCLGTTPALQRVMVFREVAIDRVNRAVTTLDGAAGKSINVAKVLKALGEEPHALSVLGGDRGDFLRRVLADRQIPLDSVHTSARTRECVTVIDECTGTHTELVEESPRLETGIVEELLGLVRRHIGRCRAVVMSGTIAPGGPVDLYAQVIRLVPSPEVLTVVDAQGSVLEAALGDRPGLVKPNRAELAATVGRALADEASVFAAMRELTTRGARRVVVTAGHDVTLAFDGQTGWRIHAPRIKAINPIGSGDAFTAGLVWRLLCGDDLGESCRWASATGTANALTLMAGEVNPEDVHRLVKDVVVETVRN